MIARIFNYLLLGLCLALVFALGGGCYYIYHQLNKPMLNANATVTVEIPPHSSASALIDTLFQQKLINSKELIARYVHYKGFATLIKAGVYKTLPNESIQNLFQRIVAGDVIKLTFQIVEGTTLYQVNSRLAAAPYLTYKLEDWQAIQAGHNTAEGLLLADTYQYDGGSNAKELLTRINKRLLMVLEQAWATRSPNLPYKTPYELLIAASILEKETALPTERAIISGIIASRIKLHMPLQMDPTVIYGLGNAYTGKLKHNDLKINSPYNTYVNQGLPPTPIAMVGKQSIEAAAHPAPSNYLYFVAKGDGTHIFSVSYTEQKKAIKRYLIDKIPLSNKDLN